MPLICLLKVLGSVLQFFARVINFPLVKCYLFGQHVDVFVAGVVRLKCDLFHGFWGVTFFVG